jgi:hypothetical protein
MSMITITVLKNITITGITTWGRTPTSTATKSHTPPGSYLSFLSWDRVNP